MDKIPFRTAQLVLRRPEAPDIDPLMAMDADPEVMRYIGNGAIIPPDRDRALRAVSRWREQWDEQGFGLCSVIARETGEYAGWVTLAVPAFLLTEAGLDRVVSIRDIGNARSERVMDKLGLRF